MGKGKLLGFIGKIGTLAGNVIPGAGVAGKLATNASQMMKDKAEGKAVNKAIQKEQETTKAILKGVVKGQSVAGAKVRYGLATAWEFIKTYWWAFLPAALVAIYLLFFKKKVGRARTRTRTRTRGYVPVRRKKTATPKGSAWARKMLLARRRKAKKK